jgi:FkbM family methyltransferase
MRPSTYRAGLRMTWVYTNPLSVIFRYVFGLGHYPATIRVRTPLGVRDVVIFSHDDVQTVNEIFCRLDYEISSTSKNVVDVGANIGISALYFLTHAPQAHCWLYEPVPQNVVKLRANLRGFESRYELCEAAVFDSSGLAQFRVESTGRYGQLVAQHHTAATADTISVECTHIDAVIERGLKRGDIDLMKIDIEGAEQKVIKAISPRLHGKLHEIVYETNSRPPINRIFPATSAIKPEEVI